MNILVLSDLHMDPRDTFGTFQWHERDLIDQIEQTRRRYGVDKVVLNGDIFELYKYKYGEIARANPSLVSYLRGPGFVYIKGNHDIVNQFGLDFLDIVNSSGQRIHIEHGHEADWLNGTAAGRCISRYALSGLKALSRSRHLMKLYFRVVEFDDQINRVPKTYNTLKYLTYALRLLKDNDVVILAHTHKLESHHTYYLNKKKRYLNCGSCSLGRFQAIVMDTETLDYELIKIESKSNILRQVPRVVGDNILTCTA